MAPMGRIGESRIGAALRLLTIGAVGLALAGCSPVGMAVGAGATVTNMAMEERGFVTSAEDKVIWTDISNRMLINRDQKLFQPTSTSRSSEGLVLLIGFVQKPEDRVEATRLAWEPDGVREVVDEIKLGRSLDGGDFAEDVYLIQQIRLKLMFDRNIRAINYSVDCIRSTVYLMGIARTPAELQRVIDHVRDVPYVRAVVNHVRVRTDPLPPIPADKPTLRRLDLSACTRRRRPASRSQGSAMTASVGDGRLERSWDPRQVLAVVGVQEDSEIDIAEAGLALAALERQRTAPDSYHEHLAAIRAEMQKAAAETRLQRRGRCSAFSTAPPRSARCWPGPSPIRATASPMTTCRTPT